MLGTLLAGCSAEITLPPSAVPTDTLTPRLMPLPLIVDQLSDTDPEQKGSLQQALIETFGRSTAFRYVSLLPQDGAAIHLNLAFIRQDLSEDLQNGVRTGVSGLSLFLLNPVLPMHYPKAAEARLEILWPDGKRSSTHTTCTAEGTATLDKSHQVEEKTAAAMERQCMSALLDYTLHALPAHWLQGDQAPMDSTMEHPALQEEFRAPLDGAQRKAAAANLCDVLGYSPEGPERLRCLSEMEDVFREQKKTGSSPGAHQP